MYQSWGSGQSAERTYPISSSLPSPLPGSPRNSPASTQTTAPSTPGVPAQLTVGAPFQTVPEKLSKDWLVREAGVARLRITMLEKANAELLARVGNLEGIVKDLQKVNDALQARVDNELTQAFETLRVEPMNLGYDGDEGPPQGLVKMEEDEVLKATMNHSKVLVRSSLCGCRSQI